jgi:hypothetical protein
MSFASRAGRSSTGSVLYGEVRTMTPKTHSQARPILLGIALIALLGGACASAGTSFPGATGAPAGAPVDAAAPAEPATGRDEDTGNGTSNAPLPRDDALIVKTGSLELEVKDLAGSLLRARTAIVGFGGYISATEQSTSEDRQIASVTYRIPADRWDDALAALKKLGTKLVGESTQALEVTGQVVDLGARIDNLKAAELELRSYIAQATKISEILDIQAQLTQVRGEIEQLTAQMENLQDQATYGTLAVTWDVPVLPVTEVRTGWDPQAEIDRAVAQLITLGQAVATVGIWLLIVVAPILLVVIVVVGSILLIARRFAPRREIEAPLTPNG